MKYFWLSLLTAVAFAGCQNKAERLPFLGRHDYIETENGTDTVYHTIKPFAFVDQDSTPVTNQTFAGKIYVADFFFTSCPTICPVMKTQMLRVYEAYADSSEVLFLSHTIDPEYDDVARLHDYAARLGVNSQKWHFVTGDKEKIYAMAQTSYYVGVRDAGTGPEGFQHSGAFILIDDKGRIRGLYNGTEQTSVDKLIVDIKILLNEING